MAGSNAAQRISTPAGVAPHDANILQAIRAAISEATLRPESDAVSELRADLAPLERKLGAAKTRAIHWVEVARADNRQRPFAESMMEQFPLDSAQGRALMSLAEALLRTPDPARADQLIAERLAEVRGGDVAPGDAERPKDTLLLRAGFALLGGVSRLLPDVAGELSGKFSVASLTKPVVAPMVRATLRRAMRMLGEAFIVGETIESALARGRSNPALALCSFDVLGEGARTEVDAQRYFDSYAAAIEALGQQRPGTVHERSSISVKLDRKSTRLNSSHVSQSRMPSSA